MWDRHLHVIGRLLCVQRRAVPHKLSSTAMYVTQLWCQLVWLKCTLRIYVTFFVTKCTIVAAILHFQSCKILCHSSSVQCLTAGICDANWTFWIVYYCLTRLRILCCNAVKQCRRLQAGHGGSFMFWWYNEIRSRTSSWRDGVCI